MIFISFVFFLLSAESQPHRVVRSGKPFLRAEKVTVMIQLHTKEILVLGHPSRKTVNRFLRCRFTNQITNMDRRLIKVAYAAAKHFKSREIQVVSAFRAPRFNEMLRKKLHEVALRSNHMLGKALDFRIPGVPASELAAYLRRLKTGGVGFYKTSKFVHFDTGPVRTWTGT